jgi:hypothetical protein
MGATDEGPMPAFDGSANATDLQTLLMTLQQTNVALGNIAKALGTAPALSPQTVANLGIYANDAAAAAAGVGLFGLYLNSSTFAVIARHV